MWLCGLVCIALSHRELWDSFRLRSMIENAWTWAQNRNKLRKNEIHGEEEAKLILDETFGFCEKEGTNMSQEGRMLLEDPPCSNTATAKCTISLRRFPSGRPDMFKVTVTSKSLVGGLPSCKSLGAGYQFASIG